MWKIIAATLRVCDVDSKSVSSMMTSLYAVSSLNWHQASARRRRLVNVTFRNYFYKSICRSNVSNVSVGIQFYLIMDNLDWFYRTQPAVKLRGPGPLLLEHLSRSSLLQIKKWLIRSQSFGCPLLYKTCPPPALKLLFLNTAMLKLPRFAKTIIKL